MGKITRRVVLGAISVLGAYYYKNPKQIKNHKDSLVNNIKQVFTKTKNTELEEDLVEKLEEVSQEEKNEAKDKLNRLLSAFEIKEDNTENSLDEIVSKEKQISDNPLIDETSTIEELPEHTAEIKEDDKELSSEEILSEITIREVGGEILDETYEKDFEVVLENTENISEDITSNQDNKLAIEETVSLSIGEIKEKIMKRSEREVSFAKETEVIEENKTKNALETIVSLFSSKEK